MTLKILQNKLSLEEFKRMANELGFAISSELSSLPLEARPKRTFIDLEIFFLAATYNLSTSRLAEGFLCWLLQFGKHLSPSKIRRLILAGEAFDPALLGSFIEFLVDNKIHANQWKILKPFSRRRRTRQPLLVGPVPKSPAPYFLKYGIVAPNFKLEIGKFLLPIRVVYQRCIELKHRALFGSIANADVASYLQHFPLAKPYQIAKETHHHKARVFQIYQDILDSREF